MLSDIYVQKKTENCQARGRAMATTNSRSGPQVHVSRRGSVDLVFGSPSSSLQKAASPRTASPAAAKSGVDDSVQLAALAEERDAALAREAHWRVQYLAGQAQLQTVVTTLAKKTEEESAENYAAHAEALAMRDETYAQRTALLESDLAAEVKQRTEAVAAEAALNLLAEQEGARRVLALQSDASALELAKLREELSAVRGSAAAMREELSAARVEAQSAAKDGLLVAEQTRLVRTALETLAGDRAHALAEANAAHEAVLLESAAAHAEDVRLIARGHEAARESALAALEEAHAERRDEALAAQLARHTATVATHADDHGRTRDEAESALADLAAAHDEQVAARVEDHHAEREALRESHAAALGATERDAAEAAQNLEQLLARAKERAADAEAQVEHAHVELERARAHHHAELRRQVRQYSAIADAQHKQLDFEGAQQIDDVETHYAARLRDAAADRAEQIAHLEAQHADELRRNAVDLQNVLNTVSAAVRAVGAPVPAPLPPANVDIPYSNAISTIAEGSERDAATAAAEQARVRCLHAELRSLMLRVSQTPAEDKQLLFETEQRMEAIEREMQRSQQIATMSLALTAGEQEALKEELITLVLRVAETDDSLVLAAAERRIAVLEVALREASEMPELRVHGKAQRAQLSRAVVDAANQRLLIKQLQQAVGERDARLRKTIGDHDVALYNISTATNSMKQELRTLKSLGYARDSEHKDAVGALQEEHNLALEAAARDLDAQLTALIASQTAEHEVIVGEHQTAASTAAEAAAAQLVLADMQLEEQAAQHTGTMTELETAHAHATAAATQLAEEKLAELNAQLAAITARANAQGDAHAEAVASLESSHVDLAATAATRARAESEALHSTATATIRDEHAEILMAQQAEHQLAMAMHASTALTSAEAVRAEERVAQKEQRDRNARRAARLLSAFAIETRAALEAQCDAHADALQSAVSEHNEAGNEHDARIMRKAVKRMLRVRYIRAFNALCMHVETENDREHTETLALIEQERVAKAYQVARAAAKLEHEAELAKQAEEAASVNSESEKRTMAKAVKRMLRVRYIRAFNALCENVEASHAEEYAAEIAKLAALSGSVVPGAGAGASAGGKATESAAFDEVYSAALQLVRENTKAESTEKVEELERQLVMERDLARDAIAEMLTEHSAKMQELLTSALGEKARLEESKERLGAANVVP